MGNCSGSCFHDPNPSSKINLDTNPESFSSYKSSHAVDHLATSGRNGGKFQFADDVSEGYADEESNLIGQILEILDLKDFSLPAINAATENLKGQILETPDLKAFSLSDLKAATENFKPDLLFRESVFGPIYKGWIDDKIFSPSKIGSGMDVAIKKANHIEQWQKEVNFLGRFSHPNLMKLLGYCWEDEEIFLVYEFMPRGNLDAHLFTKDTSIEPLPWDVRLKIAIGAARGLAFLHTSDKKVIRRNFKTSNILLDWNYNAKLSDFGMVILDSDTITGTTVASYTFNYTAPEYMFTGHLDVKGDVYAFGIVLLELLSGQRVNDLVEPREQFPSLEWMKSILGKRSKLSMVMDARIQGQYATEAALMTSALVLKCIEFNPKRRPFMKQVVQVLEQIKEIQVRQKER